MPGLIWQQLEVEYVIAQYKHRPTPEIARELNRSPAAVVYMAGKWGIRKSAKGRTAAMKYAHAVRRKSA